MEFDSYCIHGTKFENDKNSHLPPIYATSTFKFDTAEQGLNAFAGENENYIYTRWDNPTVNQTAAKIAGLEAHGIKGLELKAKLLSSGMAAISTLLYSLLKTGDKIITHGSIYGGTAELMDKILPKSGIERITVELKNPGLFEDAIKKNPDAKVLYFETPANPTIDCYDIDELTKIAKANKLTVIVDNTFCTPYLQQPFKYGVDFVVHSTTKYLNGHGTAIGGAVIGNDIEFMQTRFHNTFKLQGGCLSPFDAWLVNVGLNTLPLRMDKHCSNAMKIALFLEKHPKVSKVNYLGLISNLQNQLAKKQMKNFGGMISFELYGGLKAGINMMNGIRFCTLAASLGTIDTLILHPASMSHHGVPKEIREKHGITDGLIRLSVGIESFNDIIADIENSLKGV